MPSLRDCVSGLSFHHSQRRLLLGEVQSSSCEGELQKNRVLLLPCVRWKPLSEDADEDQSVSTPVYEGFLARRHNLWGIRCNCCSTLCIAQTRVRGGTSISRRDELRSEPEVMQKYFPAR